MIKCLFSWCGAKCSVVYEVFFERTVICYTKIGQKALHKKHSNDNLADKHTLALLKYFILCKYVH